MNAAIQKFQTIGFMRGGRISGFLDGKHTPFYLTKRLVEVPRIDDEGRPVRTAQWLIELEAPVDVAALLRPDEGLDGTESRAAEALNVLEGRPAERGFDRGSGGRDDGATEGPAFSPRAASSAGPASDRAAEPTSAGSSGRPAAAARSARTEPQREQALNGGDDAVRVSQAAAALGVGAERFERYAEKRWGRGWKMNANGRKRALDEVTGFASDSDGFRAKVDAELHVLG
jgi:hypothetical protein